MDYKLETHKFLAEAELSKVMQNKDLQVVIPFFDTEGSDPLVSVLEPSKYESLEIDSRHQYNVSIAVAAAVASYARIHICLSASLKTTLAYA